MSQNPGDLALVPYDLCWSEGGVHQVWGLGIPIWRLPFEIVARVFGQSAFPDRVALGLFMALVACLSLRTWFRAVLHPAANEDSGLLTRVAVVLAIGATVLSVFSPPMIHLLRSPMGHYEEPLLYVHFYAVALGLGLVSLARNPRKSLFLVLCALAGLGGLIRPTMVFYGGATVLIASWILVSRRPHYSSFGTPSEFRLWPNMALGICLFILGGTLLFVTNLLRFGSGLEFGHRLNLSPALPLLYMERIENPFAHVPLSEAARELFGLLFLSNKFNGVAWYDQGLFPGQSSAIRWRMIDLTTYDLSYAPLLAFAWGLGLWRIWLWLRRARHCWGSGRGNSGLPHPSTVLVIWSLISTAALAIFYLRIPMIASRYALDFSPAFALGLVGLWWWAVETMAKHDRVWKAASWSLCVTLIVWHSWQISNARSGFGGPRSITQEEIARQMQPKPNPSKEVGAEYHIGDSMPSWGIPFNGEGWNEQDGHIWSLAIFFVKDPQFIELKISEASDNPAENVSIKDIRVKIGLEFLERASIERTNDQWLVRFRAPKQQRYQRGLQTLFLATVPARELANYVVPPSPWILDQIRWRDSSAR